MYDYTLIKDHSEFNIRIGKTPWYGTRLFVYKDNIIIKDIDIEDLPPAEKIICLFLLNLNTREAESEACNLLIEDIK